MSEEKERATKINFWQKCRDFCVKHKISKQFISVAIIALVLLIIVIGLLTSKANSRISSRTVELGLKNIGELATQAGHYTSVQMINGSREVFGVTIPFTQSKYIYSYDGVVRAGFNFNEINVNLDDANKAVTISMPAPYIIDVTVDEDSLVVYDETKNIFSPLKLNDFSKSLSIMKEEVTQKAIDNGILTNAKSNAVTLISAFLQGTFPQESYTIDFIWQ